MATSIIRNPNGEFPSHVIDQTVLDLETCTLTEFLDYIRARGLGMYYILSMSGTKRAHLLSLGLLPMNATGILNLFYNGNNVIIEEYQMSTANAVEYKGVYQQWITEEDTLRGWQHDPLIKSGEITSGTLTKGVDNILTVTVNNCPPNEIPLVFANLYENYSTDVMYVRSVSASNNSDGTLTISIVVRNNHTADLNINSTRKVVWMALFS